MNMATSTPVGNTKKRINHEQLSQLTPTYHAEEDEVERRKRRSAANMLKRLSAVPSQGSPSLNISIGASIEDVKEHFKLCQKLYAENKINNKNAWNLKLIDYLNILISHDVFGKDFMLMAATSLDICAKVYACRVDDLYEKGMQLASTVTSIGREQVEESDKMDEDDHTEERDEGEKRQTKKKKKSKRLSASHKYTIAKDPKSLEVPNIAKMQSVFFVGRTNIEASNHENLFTNKLPLNHIGYKLMLLNKVDQGMPYYGEEDRSVEQDQITTLKINAGAFKICRAFSGFNIDEWDPDQEEAVRAEIDKTQNTITPENDEVVYDEQGIPVPELDGSIHDIFADEPEQDDTIEEVDNAGVANKEEEFISSFCPTNNYNFVNNDLDTWWMKKIWVGPSHWKNKFIKPRAARFTGNVNNQARPKTKRKFEIISPNIDFLNYTPTDFLDEYKASKKMKFNEDKFTLPINYLLLAPDFRILVLKLVFHKKVPYKEIEEEFEYRPYDYNNPNDSQYCSQHSLHEELDDNNEPLPDGDDIIHEEEHIANCERDAANKTTNMLANLVEAPEMIEQTYIPFALRAKKVNMKKLKSTMWEILTKDKRSNIINIEERPVKQMKLSDLYSKLPSRLPQSMRKDLGLHIVFFALLHLTNQHNLKLTRTTDLCDLTIQQDGD